MSEKTSVYIEKETLLEQEAYMRRVAALLASRYEANGTKPLAYIRAYGCQQNVSDTEIIRGMLSRMGYAFTDSEEQADFVLYNTCAVRENAEYRVLGNVGELSHNKRRKPDMLIALCGCMMQQRHIADKIQKSYPHVDLVFGTHTSHLLPQFVYEKLTGGSRSVHIEDTRDAIAEGLPSERVDKFRANLPIMYGCDNFCTYCIVPYVRGRERSRMPQNIVDEAAMLVNSGYKEITLLGQNVNSYGKGLPVETDFPELLRLLNAIPGDFQIRFMTSHPKDCTRALIDAIADCEKVCSHLHLPVQSGSDEILARMNRRYTAKEYLELIAYAKEKIPELTLSSDIIVGFPGETYEQFVETLRLVRAVQYETLFTFVYSRRSGTKAAEFEDPIEPKEKSRWMRELIELQQGITDRLHQEMVGKTVRVLAESLSDHDADYLVGRDESNILVKFKASPDWIGKFSDIHIVSAQRSLLMGKLI